METNQKIVVGIGIVASVAVVYFIWKHEQQNAIAAQDAANVDASNNYATSEALAAFTNFQAPTNSTFDLHASDGATLSSPTIGSDPLMAEILDKYFSVAGMSATATGGGNSSTVLNTIQPINTGSITGANTGNGFLPVRDVGPINAGMHGIPVSGVNAPETINSPVVPPYVSNPPTTGINDTTVTQVIPVGRIKPILAAGFGNSY